MPEIIDVSFVCGGQASALAAAGVQTVIRYYTRDTIRPTKRLTPAEALQLAGAGLRVGIVHEGRFGNQVDNFDRDSGLADGAYARRYGATTIGQPAGSAIYFGVDVDMLPNNIEERVLPYFEGVAEAFAASTGEPAYAIGVYGSGAVCKAVLDAKLASFAWLAQSKGWLEYKTFDASKRWALKQAMPATVAGVDCDPDVAGATGDFGDFALAAVTAPSSSGSLAAMFVNARHGLRLRSGPGTEFDIRQTLAFGARLHPLKSDGVWTSVDLQGDGKADGFVNAGFLTDHLPAASESLVAGPVVAGPAGALAPPAAGVGSDAAHVPVLIANGASADGLKAARIAAAKALPGYPTNGCAAHLCALLQASGIDIPMTFGAGKLAHELAQRGWVRIAVGKQGPGDIGVCFDNNPDPPGADHIYLAVETNGPDEMMIADNQRKTDALHERFATGRGRTPTEFFLRAS